MQHLAITGTITIPTADLPAATIAGFFQGRDYDAEDLEGIRGLTFEDLLYSTYQAIPQITVDGENTTFTFTADSLTHDPAPDLLPAIAEHATGTVTFQAWPPAQWQSILADGSLTTAEAHVRYLPTPALAA